MTDIGVLLDALQRISNGELVIDPLLVSRMIGRRRRADLLDRLSQREREVLALVAEGRNNEAIAGRLSIFVLGHAGTRTFLPHGQFQPPSLTNWAGLGGC